MAEVALALRGFELREPLATLHLLTDRCEHARHNGLARDRDRGFRDRPALLVLERWRGRLLALTGLVLARLRIAG